MNGMGKNIYREIEDPPPTPRPTPGPSLRREGRSKRWGIAIPSLPSLRRLTGVTESQPRRGWLISPSCSLLIQGKLWGSARKGHTREDDSESHGAERHVGRVYMTDISARKGYIRESDRESHGPGQHGGCECYVTDIINQCPERAHSR